MGGRFTVGLFGMYGLYNYGCEAIARGTYQVVKQAWPDSKVILYTFFPKEDKERIADLDIELKAIPEKKFKKLRIITNKILRTLSINKQFSIWDAKKVIAECDIVLSVGGDIYTIPLHVLDNKKEKAYNPLVELGKTVVKHRPMIVWGASIGPFGDNEQIKNYYFDHLKEMSLIVCREGRSYRYLKKNGLQNTVLYPDPAFYITSVDVHNINSGKEKRRIGLNLSPLSLMERMGSDRVLSFQDRIIHLIEELCSIPDTEIILVPHVVSPLSEMDNDLLFLEQIYNILPFSIRDSVTLFRNASSFLETKRILKSCDVLIAARMHCAVNALTEGIPTIILCYSQKGVGMTEFVYGDTYWAVEVERMNEEVPRKTIEILSQGNSVTKELRKRMSEIEQEKQKLIDLLANMKLKKRSLD